MNQATTILTCSELIKDGRSIRLPNTEGAYYGNTVRFVGWVLP